MGNKAKSFFKNKNYFEFDKAKLTFVLQQKFKSSL